MCYSDIGRLYKRPKSPPVRDADCFLLGEAAQRAADCKAAAFTSSNRPQEVSFDFVEEAASRGNDVGTPSRKLKTESSPTPAGSSSSVDMESGGGELSDSGSSGYWSWDHGNGSPAPSPSVTEVDSSPDEGLHMELEQGEELTAKKPKVSRLGRNPWRKGVLAGGCVQPTPLCCPALHPCFLFCLPAELPAKCV